MRYIIIFVSFLLLSISSSAQERRISVTQVKHVIAANFGELVFQRITAWYEYRNTDLFGVRFPFGYNMKREAKMIGINPKAYLGYGATQIYIGPKVVINFLDTPIPPIDPFSSEKTFIIEGFIDFGISFTNYKYIPVHFSINCGIGSATSDAETKLLINPGISIGYNLK